MRLTYQILEPIAGVQEAKVSFTGRFAPRRHRSGLFVTALVGALNAKRLGATVASAATTVVSADSATASTPMWWCRGFAVSLLFTAIVLLSSLFFYVPHRGDRRGSSHRRHRQRRPMPSSKAANFVHPKRQWLIWQWQMQLKLCKGCSLRPVWKS